MPGRLRTYIEDIDNSISGEIPEGSSTLIYGKPGTLKSSLAYYILKKNCDQYRNHDQAIYFLTEQSENSFRNQLFSLGLTEDMISPLEIELIKISLMEEIIQVIGPEKEIGDFETTKKQKKKQLINYEDYPARVFKTIREKVLSRELFSIVIDTISYIYPYHDERVMRHYLAFILNELNEKKINSILISEEARSIEVLTYLVDNVFYLTLDDEKSRRFPIFSCKKMRGRAIDMMPRVLEYNRNEQLFKTTLVPDYSGD